MTASDPVMLFEQATARAVTVMAGVTTEQLAGPTPCADWDVQQFMDALVHTSDLATATGQDSSLDPELVDACIVMFLPEMPERGPASGLIGLAIVVPDDASARDRLLAAMGPQP